MPPCATVSTASAADITVNNVVSEETRYSKHTRIDIGFDDLAEGITDIDELVDIDDGKVTMKIGEADYERAESVTTQTTAIASTINAGEIRLKTGGEAGIEVAGKTESGGDILIEGSDLRAEESIELKAERNVALLDAEHTTTTEEKIPARHRRFQPGIEK